MLLTTPVALPKNGPKISHKSRIMLVGSCFADNIGKRMQERKFDITVNPFGVQYNPFSIAGVLERVATGKRFDATSCEIFEHEGMWHSLLHHSSFSRTRRDELLECINHRLTVAQKAAKECDTVIITFGTAYVYTRKSDGIVAGNCHKLPGNCFDRRLLSIDEIVQRTAQVIELYREYNPKVKFLFTVSPIRHLRDGAHDNQISKATLLLAIDRLQQLQPEIVFYFPTYEILLDELRDYRFFAEDMTHPSATAVEYIWERFSEHCFDRDTKVINSEIENIIKGLSHRPFNAASEGYRQFIDGISKKIALLKEKHPYLDFENEIRQCNTLFNK